MKFNINKLIKDYQKRTGKDDRMVAIEMFPKFTPKHAMETLRRVRLKQKILRVEFIIHCLEVFKVSPNEAFGYEKS